jgi:hypothetical protein
MEGDIDLPTEPTDHPSADSPGRFRAQVLLTLAAAVIVIVAYQGIALWPRLPDRMPIHFGITGAPDGWGGKNWFSVFGILVTAAFLLVIMGLAASSLLGAKYYNFPGKERILKLPRERQDAVLAPVREGLAWLGSSTAIGLAMMARDSWLVALHQRAGISMWPMPIALVVGMAAAIIGIVHANRRAHELGDAPE